MSDDVLTTSELVEIFGPTVPMEAVELIFNGPSSMTTDALRDQLKPMGERHKKRRAAQDAAIQTLRVILAYDPNASVATQAEMVALAAIDAYEAWGLDAQLPPSPPTSPSS